MEAGMEPFIGSLAGVVGIIGLLALIIFQGLGHQKERAEWNSQEGKLLDRIMARSLTEYSESRAMMDNVKPMKVVSLEELREDLLEGERGIPVT
jgi:hypothetical protein